MDYGVSFLLLSGSGGGMANVGLFYVTPWKKMGV